MTKAQRKVLGEYCRELADALELRDWTIKVEHQPVDEDDGAHRTLADVSCTEGRKIAHVRVCPDFTERDPEQIRHVLVHELVHAHLAPMQRLVEDDVWQLIGRPLLSLSFRRSLEYAVDAIASALAKHQPLIGVA